jgi:hypothetical protein
MQTEAILADWTREEKEGTYGGSGIVSDLFKDT